MSMSLIIHDLQDSQMFALAQAAGRTGIPVAATCWQMEPWVAKSRYVQKAVSMPCLSYINESRYALQWKEAGLSGVWLPCVDDVARFTAKYHELLTNMGMRFICPDSETMERAVAIHQEQFSGILRLPETITLSAEALSQQVEHLEYPMMLKSERNHFVRFDSPATVLQFMHEHQLSQKPEEELRIQYFVDGDVSQMASAMVLFDNEGRPVRGFTGRRLRVEQTRFGPFGETLAARAEWIPELYEGAVELLTSIGWKGFAEVECKQDRNGQWYVLEINPRVSGWACLAEADGAGLLQAYYRMCAEDVHLHEACLQRSTAEYQRMIATSYHSPDWSENGSESRSLSVRLKPMLNMFFGANRPDRCFGAWDRRDLIASLLILKRTFKRVWSSYRN